MAVDPETPAETQLANMNGEVESRIRERWDAFRSARQDVAEVLTDEELRQFGFNLEVLNRQP